MDKVQYNASESADYNGHTHNVYVDPKSGMETETGRLGEAADIYGNVETAEEYGYVTRG